MRLKRSQKDGKEDPVGKRRNYRELFPLTGEEVVRLFSHFTKASKERCWIWKKPAGNGYGIICLRGKKWLAHRVIHGMFGGTATEKQVVDHLCGNPACVNPEHLEAVSDSVNILRGKRPRGKKHYCGKKTHCKKGHAYRGKNLVWEKNRGRWRRVCRECRNARARERYRRAAAKRGKD